jgi:hypothetical protein
MMPGMMIMMSREDIIILVRLIGYLTEICALNLTSTSRIVPFLKPVLGEILRKITNIFMNTCP